MGIRVKHGEGDITALAQLAALAGATEARTPQAPRVDPQGAPRGGGGGGGGRTRTSRGPMMADYGRLHYPSDRELAAEAKTREMEYQRKLIEQEEAQKRAIPVDFKYTPKQRAEIARLQNAKQQLTQNKRYSEQEKALLAQEIDTQIDTIKPTGIPRDPSAPQYPEGRGPGDTFQEPDGSWYTIDQDGNKKLMLRYDQTKEYIEQQAARRREEKILDIRHKLIADKIKTKDKLGMESERYRTPEEVDQAMAIILGEAPEGGVYREDLESELRKRIAAKKKEAVPKKPKKREYIGWARNLGVKATEEEKGMPREVQIAQAFLREVGQRAAAGVEPPAQMADAVNQATAVLEWWDAKNAD